NVTINWTGPKQMAFASYWQNLLAAHEVNATTDVSATSFADLDKGIDASWLSSAWGPSYFAPDAKASLGNCRAAPLPQWPAAASQIQGVPWPPFMTEALTQSATVFAGVMNGKQTLQTAFKNFQNVLVNYAKAQGFTVSTG